MLALQLPPSQSARSPARPRLYLSPDAIFPSYQHAVDKPSIFENLGFSAGDNGLILDSCVKTNFFVDFQAEIMGTQVKQALTTIY